MANMERNTYKLSTTTETVALVGGRQTNSFNPNPSVVPTPSALPSVAERAAIEAEVLAALRERGGLADRALLERWPGWMTPPIAEEGAYAPNEHAFLAIAAGNSFGDKFPP